MFFFFDDFFAILIFCFEQKKKLSEISKNFNSLFASFTTYEFGHARVSRQKLHT